MTYRLRNLKRSNRGSSWPLVSRRSTLSSLRTRKCLRINLSKRTVEVLPNSSFFTAAPKAPQLIKTPAFSFVVHMGGNFTDRWCSILQSFTGNLNLLVMSWISNWSFLRQGICKLYNQSRSISSNVHCNRLQSVAKYVCAWEDTACRDRVSLLPLNGNA